MDAEKESPTARRIRSALICALSNIDWRYVTPSQIDYSLEEPVETSVQVWQERLFAYEIYHQLRKIWDVTPELRSECIIHAEVRKGYQHLAEFDHMPDFLFHLPISGANRAVAEVKLAARGMTEIRKDFSKLCRFVKFFDYDEVFEILVGTSDFFAPVVKKLESETGIRIHVLWLSVDAKNVQYAKIFFDAP